MIEVIAGDFHTLARLTFIVSAVGVLISIWGATASVSEYRRVRHGPPNPVHVRRWSDRLLNGAHRRIALIHLVREVLILFVQVVGCTVAIISLSMPDLRDSPMTPVLLEALAWRRLALLAQSVLLSLGAVWMRLEWQRVLKQIDETFA